MPCVICAGETVSTVVREKVPTLQNRVYLAASEALAAQQGRLEVHACRRCGHAFNATFNPSLVVYDEHYNNDVPSRAFGEYYRQIAAHLRQRYLQNGGIVLDVGCGKGQFLQVLTDMFTDIQGIGIDPSCRAHRGERFQLIAAEFPHSLPEITPSLVVCRHTLEHIPDPVRFVRAITTAIPPGTPVFFEVPDAAWIVQNRAFWDWCYEHVNYFIPSSATQTMTLANIGSPACSSAFGGQYLWIEGVTNHLEHSLPPCQSNFASVLLDYAQQESEYVASARQQLLSRKAAGNAIVIWGMATKGIEFVAMVDPIAELVDHCVDINPAKQNQYTPLSARLIQSPATLQQLRSPLVVVVMNPCYLNEIRAECQRMSLNAECITI